MNESSDSLPLEELEKAPMPSIFSSLRATVSKPLQSVLDIEHYIKCNQRTEMLTQQYRKLMNVDTKLAGNIKRQSIAICPSIQFLPKGRTLEYFDKETYWLMLDYDHVISLVLDEKVEKASHSKYAMAVYRTISGKGLRILLKYMRPAGCTLTATELHRLAIDKAMAYFNDLLSINADIQCRDMTRLCGLSHDDKAYFNWNAEPMEITPEEVTKFYNTVVKETLNPDSAPPADASASRPSHRSKSSGKAHDSDGRWQTGIEEITTQVKRLAENWDIRFESGSHNKYLMRFTTFCHNYGADKEELSTWLQAEYGSEYKGIPDIVKTIYKFTDSFGIWKLKAPGEGYGKNPGVRAIRQWLSMRYELRNNTFTCREELRAIDLLHSKYRQWTVIDTKLENSIYDQMHLDGLCIGQKMLHAVINSDFCPDYNPLQSYLQDLDFTWEEGKHPDYIAELANMVHVKHYEGYYHSQEDFVYAFKKWLVAMTAGWFTNHIVNHTVLVLVGKGGIFKTTLLEHLLPPQLSSYFANDSSSDYRSKDFQEMGASKALVNLDEFEFPEGKNLSAFKSMITKQEFTFRRPYDRYPSILKHNTSFCATSNNVHFLKDNIGRRLLIWEVEQIDNPTTHKIDYTHVYAQALTLAKKVAANQKRMKENEEKDAQVTKGDEWVYWLTQEDIEKQKLHNELFRRDNHLAEQILRYFRVPTKKDEEGCNLKFMTASEILDRISTNPIFRQEFSSCDLIPVMERLGFKRIHRHNGDGWWVVEKDGKEILDDHEFKPGQDKL